MPTTGTSLVETNTATDTGEKKLDEVGKPDSDPVSDTILDNTCEDECKPSTSKDNAPELSYDTITSLWPTDRGHFMEQNLKDQTKRFIITNGHSKTNGPFKKDAEGRSFSEKYYHAVSKTVYEKWHLHGTLSEALEGNLQEEKKYWRQVLDRLLNVTLTLAMCNLPFRGHKEGTQAEDEGPLYSIMLDTTKDISKIDQMCEIYRYCSIEYDDNGNSKALQINECRGQGYDGASNMKGIYKGVQKKIIDVEPSVVYVHCNAHNLNLVIKDAVKDVTEMAQFYDIVQRVCVFWIEPEFEKKRLRTEKRHFGELCEDQRLEDPESLCRVTIYYRTLDIITTQLNFRFTGLHEVVSSFSVLEPISLQNLYDSELYEKASSFVKIYHNDVSETFTQEILNMRFALKGEISKVSSIKDLANMLIIENHSISASFPEVCTAMLLFLTIPVTTASAERSFSKLKLVKSYLRSTMAQKRLEGLALLSIEQGTAHKLNLSKVIDRYAEMKAWKKEF
ncbi:uncharacterized protein [Palaemon carinicauda]|uniref:uncharacterized protein n=1 Tax=Palaemon carinicauda TaxID=392227 RepID=UPI0035B685C2